MGNNIFEEPTGVNDADITMEVIDKQANKHNVSDFHDRLRRFFASLNITVAEFERKSNLSNGQAAKVMAGKMGITYEKLSGILSAYPELNPTWLVTGEGLMLHSMQQVEAYRVPEGGDPFALLEEALEEAIVERYHLQKCRTLLRAIESAQRRTQQELLQVHKEYLTLTKVMIGKQQ